MTMPEFHIREALWPKDQAPLRQVRETVFVQEQGVPVELEWDGLDKDCLHLLAEDGHGQAIGTGRLLPDGHIGRMAVLPTWRGQGVGKALLRELVRIGCEKGARQLRLNAQCTALAFYARQGFVAQGEVFDDAGIAHRRMVFHCA